MNKTKKCQEQSCGNYCQLKFENNCMLQNYRQCIFNQFCNRNSLQGENSNNNDASAEDGVEFIKNITAKFQNWKANNDKEVDDSTDETTDSLIEEPTIDDKLTITDIIELIDFQNIKDKVEAILITEKILISSVLLESPNKKELNQKEVNIANKNNLLDLKLQIKEVNHKIKKFRTFLNQDFSTISKLNKTETVLYDYELDIPVNSGGITITMNEPLDNFNVIQLNTKLNNSCQFFNSPPPINGSFDKIDTGPWTTQIKLDEENFGILNLTKIDYTKVQLYFTLPTNPSFTGKLRLQLIGIKYQ